MDISQHSESFTPTPDAKMYTVPMLIEFEFRSNNFYRIDAYMRKDPENEIPDVKLEWGKFFFLSFYFILL